MRLGTSGYKLGKFLRSDNASESIQLLVCAFFHLTEEAAMCSIRAVVGDLIEAKFTIRITHSRFDQLKRLIAERII